jgi:mRNA-degrading endonuclease HigB of HigAB toxin-antitoxin module
MAVASKAIEDDDSAEPFRLAKDILMEVSENPRFDKNDDVKSLFGEELKDVKERLQVFSINRNNIELLSNIKALDLKYTIIA